jgi:uncharacterized protein (UPF0276 family)
MLLGMTYSPGLESLIQSGGDLLDVIEVEPQTFWKKSKNNITFDSSSMSFINSLNKKVFIHSIGFPIGGTVMPCNASLALLSELVSQWNPPWVSEHLSFNQYIDNSDNSTIHNSGFMLPVLQNQNSIIQAVNNIKLMSKTLDAPIAFETASNYLSPIQGEIPDGRFFAEIAEKADCGILLDIHNLYANEKNGRQRMVEVINSLSRDKVWEIHIAGGQKYNNYYLDSHSGLVSDKLLKVLEDVIPLFQNLQLITFEIMPIYIRGLNIEEKHILSHLDAIKSIINRNRPMKKTYESLHPESSQEKSKDKNLESLSLSEWECCLSKMVLNKDASLPKSIDCLNHDNGVAIYSHLVESFRGGSLSESLKLSCRLIRLSCSDDVFFKLLNEFMLENHPCLFSSDEALLFSKYLISKKLNIPCLSEILLVETTMLKSILENTSITIEINYDPSILIKSLSKGQIPLITHQENIYKIEITP